MDCEFLKRSFRKVCFNSYRVYAGKDLDGNLHRLKYSNNDLDSLCLKAYAEGKDEFYADRKGDRYVSAKPKCEYEMINRLNQEEYDALMALVNKKED